MSSRPLTKIMYVLRVLACLLAVAGCSKASEPDTVSLPSPVPGIPAKNMVTLVDLGAKTCIPCKMMAPILEELKTAYEGRAAVIFIDVNEKPELSKPFKVMAIPTQIVYDRQGQEVFRHMGFLEKKALQELLDRTLADRP